jgi:RNA polymerase sigma-70 factor (ECF subfamily)
MSDHPDTSLTLLARIGARIDRKSLAVDPQAWGKFVEVYEPMIDVWVRRAGIAPFDADDVVQEVLLRVVEKLPEFVYDPEKGGFRPWLRRVTANLAMDQHRRAAKELEKARGGSTFHDLIAQQVDPATANDEPSTVPPPGDDHGERDMERQLLETLAAELARTQPDSWEIFRRLNFEPKQTSAEVAKALGKTRAAVYQANYRIHQEIKRLAGDLRDRLLAAGASTWKPIKEDRDDRGMS